MDIWRDFQNAIFYSCYVVICVAIIFCNCVQSDNEFVQLGSE